MEQPVELVHGVDGVVFGYQLNLGDIVEFPNMGGGYNNATVKQKKAGEIHLFRPFTHTASFSYTGGVICYIGISQWTINDRELFKRVYTKGPLK